MPKPPFPVVPPNPPPTPPTGNPAPFDGLTRKITFVCVHILRGQQARKQWQVWAYFALRIASLLLSAFAGAGLIADKVSAKLTEQVGWAFWGALILLSFGILAQVADLFGVERVATHARVLADMCDRYETELGTILEDPDPTDLLNGLADRVKNSLLDPNNHSTLPKASAVRIAAERMSADLIAQYGGRWTLPAAQRMRPQ